MACPKVPKGKQGDNPLLISNIVHLFLLFSVKSSKSAGRVRFPLVLLSFCSFSIAKLCKTEQFLPHCFCRRQHFGKISSQTLHKLFKGILPLKIPYEREIFSHLMIKTQTISPPQAVPLSLHKRGFLLGKTFCLNAGDSIRGQQSPLVV